ncbi:MAG: glycosyltransferase, partial [Pseudomonadota bacterium]|nr:glycosyltransferase [Pseudomonadota bacterium]
LYKISLKNTLQVWFANVHDKKLFLNLNIIKKQETAIVPGAGAIFNKTLKNKNLDNNKLTFMMISRIQKEKGVKEFLDTAAAFKNDLNKNFILIGSVDDRDPNKISSRVLEKYIADKSITHYEYQEGLEGYLNEASCIIHPSYREGLSTILLEAAVLKIPIITTKVPGCIDIVPNETFGLLCMPRSTHSLKSAVEKFSLLSDIDKSSMAEKTYDFVKNNFDRKQIYNKYISVINNI